MDPWYKFLWKFLSFLSLNGVKAQKKNIVQAEAFWLQFLRLQHDRICIRVSARKIATNSQFNASVVSVWKKH